MDETEQEEKIAVEKINTDTGAEQNVPNETKWCNDEPMETEKRISPGTPIVNSAFQESKQSSADNGKDATGSSEKAKSQDSDVKGQEPVDNENVVKSNESTITTPNVVANIPYEEQPTEGSVPVTSYKNQNNTTDDRIPSNRPCESEIPEKPNNSTSDNTSQIGEPGAEPISAPVNKAAGKCYCDKDRDLNTVELQCGACFKWFHEHCIVTPIGKCLPFMTNYTFVCKNCNPAGTESFVKRQSNFSQICLTTIANLIQESISQGKRKSLFSRDKEIVPFIDRNWPYLTTMQRRIKQTWHNTVQKTMLKDSEIFICEDILVDNETQQLFGIAMQDLLKIGPDYENKFGHNSALGLQGLGQAGKSRGAKRKVPADSFAASASKKPKSDLVIPKLPPHGYPLEHPFNKDGYRYILAEPDPHAPFRQEFDESSDWAGKPIPGWLYRTLVPNLVLLAMHDRAPQLKISEERLSVVGEKGYCMVRGTHGVGQGSWYFECTIEDMPEGSATRIGWSQSLGNLQAPLGFDKFSYSWRSRKGTKFHQSCGYHYSDGGYTQGDTLGFLIELPVEDEDASPVLPSTYKDKPLVKFKSYLYFEEKDEVQMALKELQPLPGSKITFFKNGVNMGVAWEDIYSGIYYPAISLYKSCTVSVNFGPNMKYRPSNIKCMNMHEAGHKALIDQTVSDLIYFTENDGKLRLDSFMA